MVPFLGFGFRIFLFLDEQRVVIALRAFVFDGDVEVGLSELLLKRLQVLRGDGFPFDGFGIHGGRGNEIIMVFIDTPNLYPQYSYPNFPINILVRHPGCTQDLGHPPAPIWLRSKCSDFDFAARFGPAIIFEGREPSNPKPGPPSLDVRAINLYKSGAVYHS